MDKAHYMQEAKDIFPQILEKHRGVIANACKEANIARSTYYQWYNNDYEFKKKCDSVQNNVGDFVESILLSKIFEERETTAIIFYCKTKLRYRGYGEKLEHNVTNNVKLTDEDVTIVERAIQRRMAQQNVEE